MLHAVAPIPIRHKSIGIATEPIRHNCSLSVVIVSFNTREVLRRCLRTLEADRAQLALRQLDSEVIVVDNGSRDGSVEMLTSEFPHVRLIHVDRNLGFAAANNLMFAAARGKYLVLLNSDAFLRSGALQRALEYMELVPETGLAGGQLIGEKGEWQPSVRQFPSILNDLLSLSGLAHRFRKSRFWGRADATWADPNHAAASDWVPGAFSIIRASVLGEIGGFDESFFLYYEEVDLCRRIRAAGYSIRYLPDVFVVHLGGESSRSMGDVLRSRQGAQLTLWRLRSCFLYYRKHHGGTAFHAFALEYAWHAVRLIRNSVSRGPACREKAAESRKMIGLIRQAWRETRGGRFSPPKPW